MLIATLGGKAQVVTFALDWLLAAGHEIRDVYLVHHAPDNADHRLRRALALAEAQFVRGYYGDQPCTCHAVPLHGPDGRPLLDLDQPDAVDGAWRTLHQLLGRLKGEGHELHLCVTGGRRLMALLAISVAALHFTHGDRLWHLYTPTALRQAAGEGHILHAPPTLPAPHLLEVPIMPGSDAFPALRQLLAASPDAVRAMRQTRLSDEEAAHCAMVWAALTPRQREVLRTVADGQRPSDVAAALHITAGTVSSHLKTIYAHCRRTWQLSADYALDYRWLQQRFGRWAAEEVRR